MLSPGNSSLFGCRRPDAAAEALQALGPADVRVICSHRQGRLDSDRARAACASPVTAMSRGWRGLMASGPGWRTITARSRLWMLPMPPIPELQFRRATQRIAAAAVGFQQHGIEPGDVVALFAQAQSSLAGGGSGAHACWCCRCGSRCLRSGGRAALHPRRLRCYSMIRGAERRSLASSAARFKTARSTPFRPAAGR